MSDNFSANSVEIIPATLRTVKAGGQFHTSGHIRVAAYARVSTEEENQQTSYQTQCEHFTSYIADNPDWEFAGMYADEGITGTSRKNRKQFNKMMEDAEAGKFDYIITKSTSRFARNTVDSLTCVRRLMQLNPPVGVFFEEDNLDTLDASGELLITIKAALAQEESNSISKNIRWSFQKRFQAGIPQVNLNRLFGYSQGRDNSWIINENQAGTVRRIFADFLNGMSANAVAKKLNNEGITTALGKKWRADSVLDILRNEKYVGDIEMQKTVTESFLTHKSIKNTGQAPKYYIKNHHDGIIDRESWDKAQARIKGFGGRKENSGKNKKALNSAFCEIICGDCGSPFRVCSYRTVIKRRAGESIAAVGKTTVPDIPEKYSFSYGNLRCRLRYGKGGGREKCSSGVVNEIAVKQSIMEMLYGIKLGKINIEQEFQAACKAAYEKEKHTDEQLMRVERLKEKISDLEEKLSEVRKRKDSAAENENAAECQETVDSFDSASSIYAQLEKDICLKITACKAELDGMKKYSGILSEMNKNYELFIGSVMSLPERNRAGMKLIVNSIDSDGGIAAHDHDDKEIILTAPDFLDYNRAIVQSFFTRGRVFTKGMVIGGERISEDYIEFETNFGIKLKCAGTGRNLRSFLGFRKCGDDGNVEIITAEYQVVGGSVR